MRRGGGIIIKAIPSVFWDRGRPPYSRPFFSSFVETPSPPFLFVLFPIPPPALVSARVRLRRHPKIEHEEEQQHGPPRQEEEGRKRWAWPMSFTSISGPRLWPFPRAAMKLVHEVGGVPDCVAFNFFSSCLVLINPSPSFKSSAHLRTYFFVPSPPTSTGMENFLHQSPPRYRQLKKPGGRLTFVSSIPT